MVASRLHVLTALEHEAIPITADGAGFSLTALEAERLAQIGEQRPGFCELGHRQVKLAQFCGVVSLGERVLEVLPKTHNRDVAAEDCRGVLLRLLRLSERFPYFAHLPAGQHMRRASLLEVFIAAFYQAVTTVIRGGLLRQYLEQREDLRVIRGRIDTTRQLGTHANRRDTVACVFDELSADNIWNRVLKRAVRVTRPWLRSADLGRRWVELMGVLDAVEDSRLTQAEVERLVFDRRAERYRVAIDWARWILAMLAPGLRGGRSEAPALLFDMNKLFESSVAAVVRRAASRDGLEVITQDRGTTLAMVHSGAIIEPSYLLRPDLLLMHAKRVLVIADTKWKRMEFDRKGRPSPAEADIYQLHAYASAYQCPELALIYPVEGDNVDGDTRFLVPAIGGGAATIHVIGIDIGDDSLPLSFGRGPRELVRLLGTS
jgi:5-methylcytosine-specific restriction enzyme subunit McrC